MVNKRRLHHLVRLLFVFVCMNVVWYIAFLLMNHSILPSPFAVYKAMFQLGAQDIAINVGYSLFRIFAGVVLALIIGLLIGLLMGRSLTQQTAGPCGLLDVSCSQNCPASSSDAVLRAWGDVQNPNDHADFIVSDHHFGKGWG